MPSRRASWAAASSTRVGSGVPKVGAPDCIEIELAKTPNTTGAPGRTSWVVAVDHVEMPLVDRQVDRLAHRAAGMVDRRRHVGELHEVAEILDRGVAPPLVERADEGRAVDRGEHRGVAADRHVARRVAGML